MSGRIIQTVAQLVIEGLKRTSAKPLVTKTDLSWLANANAQGVPLAPYRHLLKQVCQHYGPLPILQAGEALRGISHPILFVLLNTADPNILIEKELRLSRFIHSRHWVERIKSSSTHLLLRHTASPEAPLPTENLASCGQHIVLLEEIGCQNLMLRFPKSKIPEHLVYANQTFDNTVPQEGVHTWHFEWTSFEPTRRPMEGLDDVLLQSAQTQELTDDDDPISAIENTLRGDLGRTWKLETVAKHLGRSTRTLQRQLSNNGKTFSNIVLQVRTTEAVRLLQQTDLTITEIGYICGFADTAHFSRSFKKQYDTTPSQWPRR